MGFCSEVKNFPLSFLCYKEAPLQVYCLSDTFTVTLIHTTISLQVDLLFPLGSDFPRGKDYISSACYTLSGTL